MGAEQSNRRNTQFVYVQDQSRQEETQRRLEETERQMKDVVQQQRKLYEARIKLIEAEAAKAKLEAEAVKAKQEADAAKATLEIQAKARAVAQAQTARANVFAQVQAAQAQAAVQAQVIAQAQMAARSPVAAPSAAQAHSSNCTPVLHALGGRVQTMQSGARNVMSPRPTSTLVKPRKNRFSSLLVYHKQRNIRGGGLYYNTYNCFERSRSPYSLSSNDLQHNSNTVSTRPNLYPNLSQVKPSTSTTGNISNQTSRSQNNQTRNFFAKIPANETENDFVFVNRDSPSAPQRDRSASRSRGGNKKEGDDINCPTCRNAYSTRIFQCPAGHSSCENCKQRKAPCGKCGQHITDMRNITLEDYVAEMKVRCPNSVDGCRLFIKNMDVESHLKECPFGVLNCPLHPRFKHCTWSGQVSQLSFHFKETHPDFNQADVDTEMLLLNICINQQSLQFISLGHFNFLFHVKVFENERKICMAAQLIGTQMSASKWNYEVHVYNKREPRRKHMFNDVCTSSSIDINYIFNESKCVHLPLPYALTFYNEGCLAYKFFIKKNNDYNERSSYGDNKRFNGRGRGRGGAYRKN